MELLIETKDKDVTMLCYIASSSKSLNLWEKGNLTEQDSKHLFPASMLLLCIQE